MTFSKSPLIVEGADAHADLIRLFTRAIFGDMSGVVGANACRVTQTTPTGTNVRITSGQVVIAGRVQPWQGTYTDFNRGDHLVPVPGTGASPRNDLLVVRVEDPQYEGNKNPLVDNIIYPYLIPNVPAGAETLEDAGQSGMTAVPLARLELPPQTETVTNAMIKTVSTAPGKLAIANLARPRNESYKESIQPDINPGDEHAQNAALNTWQNWPVVAQVTTWVPPWATRADITAFLFGIRTSGGDPTGEIRFVVNGNTVGDTTSGYNTVNNSSCTLGTGATIDVTPWQGQTVTIRSQARRTGGSGRIYATHWSSYTIDICWRESPVF